MANKPLTGSIVTMELLRNLVDEFRRQPRGKIIYFPGPADGMKVGDTVMIREPPVFLAGCFAGGPPDPRTFTSRTTAVCLDQQVRGQCQLDPLDLALSIDEFSRRYTQPMATLLHREICRLWPRDATIVTAALRHQGLSGSPSWSQVVVDPDSGLSLRCISMYDIMVDLYRMRADVLLGFMGGQAAPEEPLYVPSAAELGLIAVLNEARAHYVRQLKRAA